MGLKIEAKRKKIREYMDYLALANNEEDDF